MKKPAWSDSLPVVTVPQRDTAKPVTMVLPYYDNPVFLRKQIEGWRTFAADLTRQLTLIVVDDGSPVTPAADVFAHAPLSFAVRLFRIGVDVRWNWLAARNIGFHHAAEGWVLVTDMDHVVTEATLRSVIYGEHDPEVIYGFSRYDVKAPDLKVAIAPHPNSWLMTREMFWKVGGYDETLSGHYGTDGEWRKRCAKTAPIHILSDRLERHEYEQDSSTTRYKRKQPEDATVPRLIAARANGWRPKTLSFQYEEVTLCSA